MVTVHGYPNVPTRGPIDDPTSSMWYVVDGVARNSARLIPVFGTLTWSPDERTIDWKRKFFEQGPPYPFDGNAVRHLKLEGDIFPPGIAAVEDDGILVSTTRTYHYVWVEETSHWYHIFRDKTGNGAVCYAAKFLQTVKGLTFVAAQCSNFTSGDSRKTAKLRFYAQHDNPSLYWRDYSTVNITYQYYDEDCHRGEKLHFYDDFLYQFFHCSDIPIRWKAYNSISYPTVGTYGYSDYQIRRTGAAILNRWWDTNLPNLMPEGTEEMAKTCLEGQRKLTVNMLNYVDKLTGWGGGIKALLDLADNFTAKGMASAWLSNRFGDRLEYGSSIDVLDALWDHFLTIPEPSKYQGTYVSRASWHGDVHGGHLDRYMRLVVSNDSYSKLMSSVQDLMEWGIWPSLVNTYDLIPFSFVLDWFTNLSTILGNVDDLVYRQYLKVLLCEETWRFRRRVALVDDPAKASEVVYLTYYDRRGSTILPEFGILAGWEPSLPSLVNIVDGASLLIQLIR